MMYRKTTTRQVDMFKKNKTINFNFLCDAFLL